MKFQGLHESIHYPSGWEIGEIRADIAEKLAIYQNPTLGA